MNLETEHNRRETWDAIKTNMVQEIINKERKGNRGSIVGLMFKPKIIEEKIKEVENKKVLTNMNTEESLLDMKKAVNCTIIREELRDRGLSHLYDRQNKIINEWILNPYDIDIVIEKLQIDEFKDQNIYL